MIDVRLNLKRSVGSIAGRYRRVTSRKMILLYHSVGETPWAIPHRAFLAQMQWLADAARLVSLEQLLGDDPDDAAQVAITFDDGYASVHQAAAPVLASLGGPAAVLLNTGHIARHRCEPSQPSEGHYPAERFLCWSQVEELAAAGWTIGSHGVHHRDHSRADAVTVRTELDRSKAAIEDVVGLPCRHFAYTWGRHTPRLRRLVSDSGYLYAYSGRHGQVGRRVDHLAIPRVNIAKQYTLKDFQKIVRGDWDFLGNIHSIREWIAARH